MPPPKDILQRIWELGMTLHASSSYSTSQVLERPACWQTCPVYNVLGWHLGPHLCGQIFCLLSKPQPSAYLCEDYAGIEWEKDYRRPWEWKKKAAVRALLTAEGRTGVVP